MDALTGESLKALLLAMLLGVALFVGLVLHGIWYSRMAERMTADQRLAHASLSFRLAMLLVGILFGLFVGLAFLSGTIDDAVAYAWNNLLFW